MPIVASRRKGQPRRGRRIPAAAAGAAVAVAVAAIAIAIALRVGSCRRQDPEPEAPAAPSETNAPAQIAPAVRPVPGGDGAAAGAAQPVAPAVPAVPAVKAAGKAVAPPPENIPTEAETDANADAPLSPLEKFAREPVKGRAEQLLMLAIPPARGTLVPPLPVDFDGDEELEREAEAMLERDIVVEDYDDEHSVMVKEWFADLRDAWHKAKAEGLTFAEFLKGCQDQADDDAALLDEAVRIDGENFADATLSDEEYLEARRNMDKYLKGEGFEGLPKAEEDVDGEDAGQVAP